jgi:hypothetical protein
LPPASARTLWLRKDPAVKMDKMFEIDKSRYTSIDAYFMIKVPPRRTCAHTLISLPPLYQPPDLEGKPSWAM